MSSLLGAVGCARHRPKPDPRQSASHLLGLPLLLLRRDEP